MAAEQNVNRETLNFIYEATKDGPESQKRDVDAMDMKTIQVFAAAAVILGLTSFAIGSGDWPTTVLFGGGVVAFAVCMYFTLAAIRVRDYFNTVHAEHLWPQYWDAAEDEIKHALVKDISDAYKKNQEAIKEKAEACQGAIYAAGFESLLIGAGLVIARL